MEPLQHNQGTEPEPAPPAAAPSPPPALEPTGPVEPAAREWLQGMGVKAPEAPAAASTSAPRHGRGPLDGLNQGFQDRLTRKQQMRRLEQENARKDALLEKLSSFLGPLMEAEPEAPALPELPDPSDPNVDPRAFYQTAADYQRAALLQALDEKLGPVLPVLDQLRQEREQQAQERQQFEGARAALHERMQDIQMLEHEYVQSEAGQGYLERIGAYLGARERFLLDSGYPPQQAKAIVLGMMNNIVDQSQRLPGGPVHPIAWLDRVIQHEMPWLAGQNGHGAAPAGGQPAPAPAPPASRTARELQAAANSGVAGSVGQHGRVVAPKGGDLEAAMASGKLDAKKLRELLRERNGGKMPTDLSDAMIRIQEEVSAISARRSQRR